MSKTYYMHTIGGKPAYFDGSQIVFATFYGKANPLATSLKQIRDEQEKSRRFRESKGWRELEQYGHFRFRVPETDS